ncbi:tetratricopeptide repeat protein [Aurantiacibacter sp. D1-12]|uniref:tetratricopeptide repeat protein n=1 Tax=Aurantiacibacter sp. D1-12 TaxID=2993658 RepID=UPI00237C8428|nr:tetratricopeptide repeat protein [Aurantiacibacter sp. D1-12]MDE1467884.1 tetratricopeptide repeat protein [Aurantiacibacter sp. D1-12]
MARTPTETNLPDKAKPETRKDAEQEMLMREVDEAVRQDEVTDFAKKYGWPVGIGLTIAMAIFGGVLFWQSQTEAALEERSESLVMAMDELEAGNVDIADGELAQLSDGTDGAAAAAAMMRAGIAIQQDRIDDAVALFDSVANNTELPAEYRDIAAIRSVTLQFDDMEPQAVIDRIGPLAQPDNAYYGSAGELVAHAYLALDQRDQAGPLLVAISQNEDVPGSIRGRTRQLAGLLGFDPIDDVDAALAEITGEDVPSEGEVELVE